MLRHLSASKRLLSRGLLLVLLLTTGMVASAQDEPVVGGTLRVALPSFTSLNPLAIADDSSFYVASQIYSSLVRNSITEEGTLEPIPDLAESWEYEEDGKVVIFHLRQGVTFHDGNAVFAEGEGREVVAADVVYSIERSLNTEGSTAALPDLVASFVSVEAVDDYTVKLTLNQPNALLFSGGRGLASTVIYAQEAIEQLGEAYDDTPIGSGPFEFVEYLPDDHITLQRNEDYWIQSNVDEVLFRIIPEDSVALIALEAGEIDIILGVPEQDIARMREDSAYSLIGGICPVADQFIFPLTTPPFDNVNVRHALAIAVDGNNISRAINPETHIDGCGAAGPGVTGHDPDMCTKYFNYDPEQAVAILNEEGYTDSDGDGILDKDGTPLTVEIEVWSEYNQPRYGEAVATQLRDIGVNVDLQVVEFGTAIDDFIAGVPKVHSMFGWCGEGGTTGLWGTSGFATSMGSDQFPEAQALLTESNTLVDRDERDAAVREAANMLYSQYVSIPVGFVQSYFATSSKVQDFGGVLWWFNIVTETNNTWIAQ